MKINRLVVEFRLRLERVKEQGISEAPVRDFLKSSLETARRFDHSGEELTIAITNALVDLADFTVVKDPWVEFGNRYGIKGIRYVELELADIGFVCAELT